MFWNGLPEHPPDAGPLASSRLPLSTPPAAPASQQPIAHKTDPRPWGTRFAMPAVVEAKHRKRRTHASPRRKQSTSTTARSTPTPSTNPTRMRWMSSTMTGVTTLIVTADDDTTADLVADALDQLAVQGGKAVRIDVGDFPMSLSVTGTIGHERDLARRNRCYRRHGPRPRDDRRGLLPTSHSFPATRPSQPSRPALR